MAIAAYPQTEESMANPYSIAKPTGDPEWVKANTVWQERLAKDAWAGWRALLSGVEIGGYGVPVSIDDPFCGFYRWKQRDKTYKPVAFWYDPDDASKMLCVVDGELVEDNLRAREIWTYCCAHPVTHEAYTAVVERGEPWSDSDPRLTPRALKRAASYAPGEEATTNNPPAESPLDECRNKIANAKGGLDDYKTIADDEQLARAKSLKNRLTELAGEADKQRDALKRPHLEAGRAVDAEWMPVVNDAKDAARAVQASMDAYATKMLQARRAAEAEVERRRLKEQAEASNEAPAGAVAPAPIAETTTRVQPGYGRAGSIKTENKVTDITDIDALFGFLKTHKELREKMLELAQRAVSAGYEVPGVKIEERAKVK
jgi:hypothetical protein